MSITGQSLFSKGHFIQSSIFERVSHILSSYPESKLKHGTKELLNLIRSSTSQIDAHHLLEELGRPDLLMFPSSSSSFNSSANIRQYSHFLPNPIDYNLEERAMAYLATQIPYSYGIISMLLEEMQKSLFSPFGNSPSSSSSTPPPLPFKPLHLLDFGCGPGTAIWSAKEHFKSIELVTAVDVSESMLLIADKMLSNSNISSLSPSVPLSPIDENCKITFRKSIPINLKLKYDLVIANFVLSELSDDGIRKSTIDTLWQHTKDILILVDRGTPEGYKSIIEARKQILIKEGHLNPSDGSNIASERKVDNVHILAPCPHEFKCPMIGSWCHFSHRIPLTATQIAHIPSNKKGFEDCKYSYVIIRRSPRNTPLNNFISLPRIIRRPLKKSGHILVDACASDQSFKRIIVARSHGKDIYKDARKAKWGQVWPHAPKKNPIPITTLKVKGKGKSIPNGKREMNFKEKESKEEEIEMNSIEKVKK